MTRWRWPVAVLAGAIVVGSGGYAVAQSRGSDVSYRTVTASMGDVERTLDLSGTITAAGRRDLSFGAAGSVAKVVVGAGQQVRSGQVLARLDPTSFDAAVTSAVATLARAEAQLASDEDAQAAAVTAVTASTTSTKTSAKPRSSPPSSTGSSPASPAAPSAPAATVDPALQQLLTQLTAEQKAVTEAQSAATEALTASRAALDAQAESCRNPSGSSGDSPGDPSSAAPTAAPSLAPSAAPPDGAGDGAGDGPDDGGLSSACAGALATVQAAQEIVADRQDTLQSALSTLGETLGQAVTAVGKPTQATGQGTTGGAGQGTTGGAGQGTTGGAGQGTTGRAGQDTTGGAGQDTPQSSSQEGSAQPSTGASEDSSGQGRTGSVTAARLAQDQADIDTANARLIQARAEREAATLRAPYAGRILRSDLSKGDLVAASDPAFVLVGQGVTTVSTTVTTAQVPSVRRGQRVTVVPAGWTTPLSGTVSAIGLLPDSDSAFPVTVTLAASRTVAEGTTASVSIVTGSAENVVTVPLSALTRTGDRATVQVLARGKVTRTQVTVGVVGTRTVSITQGLGRGSAVVLADLDAEVPSSTTSRQRAGGTGLDGSRLRPASPRRGGQ